MDLFTIWLGNTNPICRLCILSWIKLGYKPTIYVNLKEIDEFFLNLEDKINLVDYTTILDKEPYEVLLHFTDYFRYIRLYKMGGTWLDADMFLIRQLPEEHIIISSERTQQKGAYKSHKIEIANIGVLRFPANDPLIYSVIKKIDNSKAKTSKLQKNMFYFQKTLYNDFPEYIENISPAWHYCPANYNNVKCIYYSNLFNPKYGQIVNQPDWILEHSYCCHLWENLSIHKHNIDFEKIKNDSLFMKLYLSINSINDSNLYSLTQ